VVCSSLGFTGGQAYSSAYFGEGSGSIWMDNVDCAGTESSLSECDHNGWGEENCSHREDAGVSCDQEATTYQEDGNIQLVDGDSSLSGRVEIFYDGEWGTVCDDYWDDNDAAVVCSSLGFTGGQAYSSAYFGEGSGSIWMDNVDCAGTESSLSECDHNGWGEENCSHGEDAGVSCDQEGAYNTDGSSIINSTGYFATDGNYYSVSSNALGYFDAQASCEADGAHLASILSNGENLFLTNLIEDVTDWGVWIGLTDVAVEGNWVWDDGNSVSFLNFEDGEPNGSGSENCAMLYHEDGIEGLWNDQGCDTVLHFICKWENSGTCIDSPESWTNTAGEVCDDYVNYDWCTPSGGYGSSWSSSWGTFSDWADEDGYTAVDACCECGGGTAATTTAADTIYQEDGSIRLVDGDSSLSGRVEIFHNGEWGTICDDSWDDSDAAVACASLGFAGGQAYSSAYFGEGSGAIWMDEVDCKGTESSLVDCVHNGWGEDDCSHGEDAGVSCEEEQDSELIVFEPDETAIFYPGDAITIFWAYNSELAAEEVDITLMKGDSLVLQSFEQDYSISLMSCEVKLSEFVLTGSGFRIQLVGSTNSNIEAFSGYFVIEEYEGALFNNNTDFSDTTDNLLDSAANEKIHRIILGAALLLVSMLLMMMN